VHNHAVKKPVEVPSCREESRAGEWYDRLLLLNKRTAKWNPLLWLHFFAYLLGNYIAAIQAELANQERKKASYSLKQKRRISIEAAVIVLLQVAIFVGTGADLWAYFWAGPVAYLLAFAILMAYIFTNHTIHSVNARQEVDDPLLTTISVEVQPVFNKLHLHFAYHTEHHLFPSLNSDYYPLVSKILKEKYPEKYNYLHLQDAWKELWQKYVEEVKNRTALPKGPVR
jgi:fatty acid desaturase